MSAWIAPCLWAGLIFYLSSIPGLKSPWDAYDFFLRKGAHVIEYAVLAFLIARAASRTGPFRHSPWRSAFVMAVLYALSDEWHQSFVPNRQGSWIDVGIDSVGAGLGSALHWKAARWPAFRGFR